MFNTNMLTGMKRKIELEMNTVPKNLIIICGLFVLWFLFVSNSCPCPSTSTNNKGCTRVELFGIQYNHMYFFLTLGFFFPNHFFIIQALGIIWEIFEYLLDVVIRKNKNYLKLIGGCFDPNRSEKNVLNPIDRFLNIKKSTVHGWHHSVAEVLTNIVFYKLGQSMVSNKNLFVITFIILFVFENWSFKH